MAVDIGGTFTDLVSMDSRGTISNVKVLTTPSDPSKGILLALEQVFNDRKATAAEVELIVHATTLASNALLTNKIPRVCLVTTKGFRDVLEIGRQNRPELYNLQVDRPRPLVPRHLRFEADERIGYDGKIIKPLESRDSSSVASIVKASRSESVAVSLLHSYANNKHERDLARILKRECPELWLTLSSELLPEFREYERTSTTVVNACLQPLISVYLQRLSRELSLLGIRAPVHMMQSNGGTISSEKAIDQPARIIESGPVAGAVAAKYFGALNSAREIISFDVGGTTSKAGVWVGERFELTTDYEVGGRMHGVRRVEGSGYPVRLALVDLVEVGTGGGSIARLDSEGILHVGPESAGAIPGPACYGKGGRRPTLTDAHMVLGRLNQDHLLGGGLRVYPSRAYEAVDRTIARKMGRSVRDSALAILRIAISNMASALRAASIERGKDPRGMLLIAFGGAGPMHACEVAAELGMTRILVPPSAGLFSSLGLLLAEPSRDYVQTIMVRLEDAEPGRLNDVFEMMRRQGSDALVKQGVAPGNFKIASFLDLRYAGQGYELSIQIPNRRIDRSTLARARTIFDKDHASRYGYLDQDSPVELVNLRLVCTGKKLVPRLSRSHKDDDSMGRVHLGTRRVTFIARGPVRDCPILDRQFMRSGFKMNGPCIVEDYDSTLTVPSGAHLTVDDYGAIRIRL